MNIFYVSEKFLEKYRQINNILIQAAGGRAPTRFESCERGGAYEYIRGTYDMSPIG